jgi:hypothetical protein
MKRMRTVCRYTHQNIPAFTPTGWRIVFGDFRRRVMRNGASRMMIYRRQHLLSFPVTMSDQEQAMLL